jgi:hypothetical protein
MEQFNRALTFIFILIFAFGVAFFIFYRLGLFQKIFPQVKMSLPAFFSGTAPTPTLTPTLTPTPTPSGEVIVGQENIPTSEPTTTTSQPAPSRYPTIATPYTRQIPGTGSPTILLPILGSLFGVGLHFRKKS